MLCIIVDDVNVAFFVLAQRTKNGLVSHNPPDRLVFAVRTTVRLLNILTGGKLHCQTKPTLLEISFNH